MWHNAGRRLRIFTMSGERNFLELIEQVRAGDEDAARQLVAKYEPQVRRIIRVRLTDPVLRRHIDSMDVCQSVMAEFFTRVVLGQYTLETPQQLVHLLAVIARNRVINHGRNQRAARRDARRLVDVQPDELACDDPTPSRIVEARELLDQVKKLLNEQEKFVAERRAMGESWSAIARQTGSSPAAVRMRQARAVERISRQLDLEGRNHD